MCDINRGKLCTLKTLLEGNSQIDPADAAAVLLRGRSASGLGRERYGRQRRQVTITNAFCDALRVQDAAGASTAEGVH